MKTKVCIARKGVVSIALAASVLIAGCGLDVPGAPPITGPSAPSEFALSVTVTATPDQLPRDGASQSTITVLVRDAQGRPVSGQRLSVASSIGTVSQNDVVTNADGRATFTFTAPGAASVGNLAVVQVVPVSGNADNAIGRTVSILITGVSNSTAPTPAFTFTPAAPERLQRVTFNATTTTDEGVQCGDACTYSWNFDGEATGTGRITAYSFQQARNYVVTLTVRDPAGTSAGTSQNVLVINPAVPTASFTSSPLAPSAAQSVQFNASASTAAAGHTITRYSWNFGDGSTTASSSATTSHSYSSAGVFTVTLTVTDDVGQTDTTSSTVNVSTGITVTFTVSPTNPRAGDTVSFNGSGSTTTTGATITKYLWDFGDGSEPVDSGSTATTTHVFSVGGGRNYTVRLTVTDSAGRTATTTLTVTVT